MSRHWSSQQNAIFAWFKAGIVGACLYLIVRARAGTGKTTTIIEGINQAPEKRILLAAFNKSIAVELATRITNPNAEAKTLHALGYAAVRAFWGNVQVDNRWRAINLAEKVTPRGSTPESVIKVIAKLHTLGREQAPHATKGSDLIDLAYAFDCEAPAEFRDEFPVERLAEYAVRAMELAASEKPYKGIDYADMLYLPVRNRWTRPAYDLVVIDEAQDMTITQLELAQGVLVPGGRLGVIGDDRQAIYGFRGADSQSLDRLKAELQATELGLTTTYRCGKVIVDLARVMVPDFEAGADNPQGEILDLSADKLPATAEHGDFILSRKNAPLVSVAMQLLRAGKRARVKGRDIGAGLKTLLAKLVKGSNSIPLLLTRIEAWRERETERVIAAKRPEKVDQIMDQADMLIFLCDGARGVSEVETRIDDLFTDDGLGDAGIITCSSVHKAKGLEADRVFLLADTFNSKNQEEINIQYVAVTRAKKTLVWIHPAGTVIDAPVASPAVTEAV